MDEAKTLSRLFMSETFKLVRYLEKSVGQVHLDKVVLFFPSVCWDGPEVAGHRNKDRLANCKYCRSIKCQCWMAC